MLVKYNNHIIEIYDSIETLPIDRFQMYNMKVLIDAGIGGDLNGFNTRMSNVLQLIDKDVDSAKKELTNLHQNVLHASICVFVKRPAADSNIKSYI